MYTRNKDNTKNNTSKPVEKKAPTVIEDNDVSNAATNVDESGEKLEIPTVSDEVRNKEKAPIKPVSDGASNEENNDRKKSRKQDGPRNPKDRRDEGKKQVKGIDLELEQELGNEKAFNSEL